MEPPTLYLFGGSNGAGKTTFARAYLTTVFEVPPRFLNADELARGLSPFEPTAVPLRAGKLLLSEIDSCLKEKVSFALESTLSGQTQATILKRAKALGYQIEIHYLWIPSIELSIERIAQRVDKGGHPIPPNDIRRRFFRSRENFAHQYAAMADFWALWDNTREPPRLRFESRFHTLKQLEAFLLP